MPLSARKGGAARRAAWLVVAVAGLSLATAPAAAQDIPWGKGSKKSTNPTAKPKQRKQQPKQQRKQQPKQQRKQQRKQQPKQQPKQSGAAAAPVVLTPQQTADQVVEEVLRRTRANPFPGSAPATKPARPAADPAESPLDALHGALARYGLWVDHAEHGTVWIPDPAQVGSHFAPYRSGGRWAVDEQANWSWVSDYPWGDLAFHFGNWTWLDEQQGWAWVPGSERAPAWVVWRLGDAAHPFVGWAPTPPSHRWVHGQRQPLGAGTRTLAFWYVPARDLFAPTVASKLTTEPAALAKIHQHSSTFAGNLSQCMSTGGDLSSACERSLATPWLAATPSFADARMPLDAIPVTRLAEPQPSLSEVVQRLVVGPEAAQAAAPEPIRQPTEQGSRNQKVRPRAGRVMRRCVRTRSHGLKCWNYRWPPLWRGRR